MMNATRAWIVAASIGAVEAMKDQGICRWNSAIRSIQQNAKSNLRSFTQAQRQSSCSSSPASAISREEKAMKSRKTDERIRKVMDLSCWGPNTVRF